MLFEAYLLEQKHEPFDCAQDGSTKGGEPVEPFSRRQKYERPLPARMGKIDLSEKTDRGIQIKT